MTPIKTEPILFGTDGWRGLIARDFTFANVRRVADALARALPSKSRVVIGHDHRFLSEEFARTAAGVLAARGHRVLLGQGPTTSPALSFALKGAGARAGVMITASHNPPAYNGFKIKLPPGRSADPLFTTKVETLVEPETPRPPSVELEQRDLAKPYLAHLLSRLDRAFWKKARSTRVVFDAMHGTGGVLWAAAGAALGLGGEAVRVDRDPLFGGVSPEPIERHLAALSGAVRAQKAVLGVAVDGDGDRLGAVDEKGVYLPPHAVFPLILRHLVENRRLKGAVVQAVSLGYLSERLAKEYKLPFVEVPVGFKYVADQMAKIRVLWGGEESGGYGVGLWGPERDGVLTGLLLVEAVLAAGKPLSVLRKELTDKLGASEFSRVDHPLKAPVVDKAAWVATVTKRIPAKVGGVAVKETRNTDGLKVVLTDGSWVLLRPSGTEPLLRAYAESPTAALTQQLLTKAQEWAGAKNI